jgi:hypothetical protein
LGPYSDKLQCPLYTRFNSVTLHRTTTERLG